MAVPTTDGEDDSPDDGTSDSDEDFLRAVARAPSLSPAPPPTDEPELTRLAHFRLDGTLGRGGMGIVYRASDEKLDRVVALKVLPSSFADDPPRRRRFLREARLAASLTHPNVATVHEIGEADGRIYIAMELVPGVTLRKRIERGPMPVFEALRIAKEVARGVARAHERGIAHRDLKPDNVMVDDAGAVKVLDFGLAKPTEVEPSRSEEPATLTQEGRIMGTPGYMSPEQATGRNLDVRTDVFSMGVLLYEMLSGRRPFVGETPMDVVIATSRDLPRPLSQLRADLPAAVEQLVARCLQKDPSDRPASAQELLAALDTLDTRDARRATPRRWRYLIGAGAIAIASAIAFRALSARPVEPRTEILATAPAPATSPAARSEAQSAQPVDPPARPVTTPPPSATPILTPKPLAKPAAKTSTKPVAAPDAATIAPAPSPPAAGGVISVSPY